MQRGWQRGGRGAAPRPAASRWREVEHAVPDVPRNRRRRCESVETRRALLLDGAGAFGGGAAEKAEHFEGERVVEGGDAAEPEPLVERLLREAERVLGAIGEAAGDVRGRGQEFGAGDRLAHEADALGL